MNPRRRTPGWMQLVMASTLLFTAVGTAGAQEAGAQGGIEISTEIPELGTGSGLGVTDGKLQLSLDEAIRVALQRNLGLVVQRYSEEQSSLTLGQNLGIYDLLLTANVNSFDETSPSAGALDGADIQTTTGQSWNLNLSQLVKTGATLSLDFNNNRRESNSRFASLNPSYSTDFDLSISQPLLRNMGQRLTERGILVARTNLEISQETFAQQVSDTIQQVVNAYWVLVGNRSQLEVSERSLELAEQLHDQNKVRVEVGTLAPLELVQSEAGIATRQEEIIQARAAVRDAEDSVRSLLNLDLATLWDVAIETTTPARGQRLEVDLGAAIESALERRPELVSKRLSLDNLELDADFFANQRLPQLDFTARYGFNGLGGPITERDFFTGEILFEAPGDYNDALNQITDGEFAGWSVGLALTYPIQNRAAEAQSASADIALDLGQAELRNLELQVVTEVRKAARALETAAQVIDSAGVSKRLAQRTLEAEEKRYTNGMSTSYRVLEIQRDLTDAERREVGATTGYRLALAEFLQATGSLNEESGVSIVTSDE